MHYKKKTQRDCAFVELGLFTLLTLHILLAGHHKNHVPDISVVLLLYDLDKN